MLKRSLLAGFLVFAAWAIMDYLLHGLLLKSTYEASAAVLRPMNEMNATLVSIVKLILIVCFVWIYQRLITTRSLWIGIKYGSVFGLATGVASGFGTYIHSPIPLTLAWAWFIGGFAKMLAAGAIIGLILGNQEGVTPKAL